MAVYSIKEFASMVNKPSKSIHTYITRKKLIKNKNKQIDTNDEINKIFLELYGTPQKEKPKRKSNQNQPTTEKTELSIKAKLEIEQKKLAIEKAKKENKLKDIELKKENGSLLELDQTINIVSSYSDNLNRELLQNIQTLIQDICSRHNIETGKAGEYKLKVANLINNSNEFAIEVLLKQFGDDK